MSTAVKRRETLTVQEIEHPSGVPSNDSAVINVDAESMLTSIREVVRQLPADRINEIFVDFESAVKSKNINFLADTIANWALGGQGYDRLNVRVNKTLDRTADNRNDPALAESWTEFLRLQQSDGGE